MHFPLLDLLRFADLLRVVDPDLLRFVDADLLRFAELDEWNFNRESDEFCLAESDVSQLLDLTGRVLSLLISHSSGGDVDELLNCEE